MRWKGEGGEGGSRRWKGEGGASDSSSFFFSNFPNDAGEKDMVRVFQKWGRVKDVFIARRLNKWGRRFGFVRFYGIRDVERLERELDQIYIGSRKLYVNIPKYRRSQYDPKKEERKPLRESKELERKRYKKAVEDGRKDGGKKIWVEKSRHRTYAEAVNSDVQDEWKGLAFHTQQMSLPWLKTSVVGFLGEGMDFGMLGEELVKGGMSMVRARALGDNLVLLTPREGESMEVLLENNKEWFHAMFTEVKPWSLDSGANHKSVWVKCFGLPLMFWNWECFSKVIGEMPMSAKLVSIDKSTLSWEVLEYARLKVRVQNFGSVKMARKMRINKHECNIVIEEEVVCCEECGCNGNSFSDASSDSVSSLDTYVDDTDLSDMVGEEKGRCRDGVVSWPEWRDGKGNEGGDDEQDEPKSSFKLEGPTSKSKVGQIKGDFSSMNEGSMGQEANIDYACDSLPGSVRDRASHSTSLLPDSAKVVFDIECLSNHKVSPEAIGWADKNWAQLEGGGSLFCEQKSERFVGPAAQPTLAGSEIRESECKNTFMYPRQSEGSVVGDSLEEGQANSGHSDCNTIKETYNGERGEERGQHEPWVTKGASEDEESAAIMESVEWDANVDREDDGVVERRKSSSPLRHRKKKGLTELGDSCYLPRRSGRIKARLPLAEALVLNKDEGSVSSISDTNIICCNVRLAEPVNMVEPSKLWEVGKLVGIRCRGDEEEVVREYGSMEARDSEVVKISKEGSKNLS